MGLFVAGAVGVVITRPETTPEARREQSSRPTIVRLDGSTAGTLGAGAGAGAGVDADGDGQPDGIGGSAIGGGIPGQAVGAGGIPGQPGTGAGGGAGTTNDPFAPAPGAQGGTTSGGLNAPKPGTYTYETRRDGNKSNPETRTIQTLSTGGGGTRQASATRGTLLGEEITIVTELLWTAAGSTAPRTVFQIAGGDANCDWNPDIPEYVGDLSAGRQWGFDASCAGQVQGGELNGANFELRRQETKRVTGDKREMVGTTAVSTWTIAFEEHLEFGIGENKVVTNSDGVENFAAEFGVAVAEERTTTATAGPDEQSTTELVRRLRSLTPQ